MFRRINTEIKYQIIGVEYGRGPIVNLNENYNKTESGSVGNTLRTRNDKPCVYESEGNRPTNRYRHADETVYWTRSSARRH